MYTRISVSPCIVDWVEKTIPRETIPDNVYTAMQAWRTGNSLPTFDQLEKISKKLGVPFGYFFLKKPPVEDIPLIGYRTINSIGSDSPSRDLVTVIHDMQMIQEWMKERLKAEGAHELELVGSSGSLKTASDKAVHIRSMLGMELDWTKKSRSADAAFSYARNAICNAGVIVMMNGIVGNNTHRPLRIEEFRAFAMIDEYAPLIFINSNDTINGKLFSLLHEFVHVCEGVDSLFNDRYSIDADVKAIEVICNAVSAELIVPLVSFRDDWKSLCSQYNEDEIIRSLARSYRCGETIIARRAFDQGYISDKKYASVAHDMIARYNEAKILRKERPDGGDYYRTMASRIDKRFLSMLISSVQEGSTAYSEAFRLTHTNRSTFSELIERTGGVG